VDALGERIRPVRLLGALYLRLVGKPQEIYQYLEPLYYDYRKVKKKIDSGELVSSHVDEFIDELLQNDYSFEIVLPHLPKRHDMERQGLLEPRKSLLEEDFEALSSDEDSEGEEKEAGKKKDTTKEAEERPKKRSKERETKKESEEHSKKRSRSKERETRKETGGPSKKRNRSRSKERKRQRRTRSRERRKDRRRERKSRSRSRDRGRNKDEHRSRRSKSRSESRERDPPVLQSRIVVAEK